MTDDQRAEWRKALAAKAKATRNQRGRRKRGLTTVTRAGMVRVPAPQAADQRKPIPGRGSDARSFSRLTPASGHTHP